MHQKARRSVMGRISDDDSRALPRESEPGCPSDAQCATCDSRDFASFKIQIDGKVVAPTSAAQFNDGVEAIPLYR